MLNIRKKSELYAVFGNPVKHSLSPQIHQLFAQQHHIELEYKTIEASRDGFADAVNDFFTAGGAGANVTIPFKEQAYRLGEGKEYIAPDSSPANINIKNPHRHALLSQSANTLYIAADNSLAVANTDGIGLEHDISANLVWDLDDKNILVLGAGGAVRGILPELIDTRAKSIVIANRTAQKATDLVMYFHAIYVDDRSANFKLNSIPLSKIDMQFDLIINGSAVGLGNGEDNFFDTLKSAIHNDIYCYDLVYKLDEDTDFIKWAKANGVKQENSSDGLGMLVEQAARSFAIWQQLPVDTPTVLNKLRRPYN